MIKAVIFDMFETLVSLFSCENYPGRKIAADAGIPPEQFFIDWHGTDDDRTCGKKTFEEVIESILKSNNCYTDALFSKIVRKRKKALRDAFACLHPDIIPMLKSLKDISIRIALITNCYLEERDAIRESPLWEYFDVPCLSCECGIMKPDRQIFRLCLDRLGCLPEECLYVGDGGSHELETAGETGMYPLQAVWYLKEGTTQPAGRLPAFESLGSPMDILRKIEKR